MNHLLLARAINLSQRVMVKELKSIRVLKGPPHAKIVLVYKPIREPVDLHLKYEVPMS